MAGKRGFKIFNVPEREVVRAVQNHFANNPNVRIWRRNTGAVAADYGNRKRFVRFGQPGMSDFFGVVRTVICPECGRVAATGVHLEIECKRHGGRLTPQQKEYIEGIRKMNGIAFVASPRPTPSDPTGMEGLHKLLDSVDRKVCVDCLVR